jgi:hypothetical protein
MGYSHSNFPCTPKSATGGRYNLENNCAAVFSLCQLFEEKAFGSLSLKNASLQTVNTSRGPIFTTSHISSIIGVHRLLPREKK